MTQTHSLLKRQLKRYFGDDFSVPAEWQSFIDAVNEAYHESDTDRAMLEWSLELSSQELFQANSEMQAVFQAIPDLLFRLDDQGTILAYQAGNTSHLYQNSKVFLEKRIQDVPLKHIGDKFQKAISQVKETRSIVSFEYSLTMQDQKQSYEARLIPLLENQIVAIVRNISDYKQAEAALRSSLQFLETLIDTIPHPIFYKDVDLIYQGCKFFGSAKYLLGAVSIILVLLALFIVYDARRILFAIRSNRQHQSSKRR